MCRRDFATMSRSGGGGVGKSGKSDKSGKCDDGNNHEYFTDLFLCAQRGDTAGVVELLAAKVDVATGCVEAQEEIRQPHTATAAACPLYIAALNHHPQVVQALLDAKASASQRSDIFGGANPLHAVVCTEFHEDAGACRTGAAAHATTTAATSGDIMGGVGGRGASGGGDGMAVLRLLLEAKANGGIIDSYCRTPLHMAADAGMVGAVRGLLAAKCRGMLERTNLEGETPVYVAARGGHAETVRALAAARCDVNKPRYHDGHTPAHAAVALGCAHTLRVLAEVKCDLRRRNGLGQSPADVVVAATPNRTDVLRLLAEAGGDGDDDGEEEQEEADGDVDLWCERGGNL